MSTALPRFISNSFWESTSAVNVVDVEGPTCWSPLTFVRSFVVEASLGEENSAPAANLSSFSTAGGSARKRRRATTLRLTLELRLSWLLGFPVNASGWCRVSCNNAKQVVMTALFARRIFPAILLQQTTRSKDRRLPSIAIYGCPASLARFFNPLPIFGWSFCAFYSFVCGL